MARLFLCIATGHNVANVPSVLTLGQKGDVVLWIESEFAKIINILPRTFSLLEKKGFSNYVLSVKDEELIQPVQLAEHLKQYILKNSLTDLFDEFIFVMNGGQKSAVIGVQKAFFDLKHPLSMAYQDLKPIKIFYFPHHGDRFHAIEIKNPLSLEDILSIYGYHLNIAKNQTLLINKDNYRHLLQQFEQNDVFMARFHSFLHEPEVSEYIYRIFSYNVREEKKYQKVSSIGWNEFKKLHYEALKERGEKIIRELLGTRDFPLQLKGSARQIAQHLISRERQFKMFEGVFQFIVQKISMDEKFSRMETEIPEEIAQTLVWGKWLDPLENTTRKVHELKRIALGPLFEQFVLYRILKFLENEPEFFDNIHEIYTNVNISTSGDKVKRQFESDIIVVFKNSTIISLEVKAFHFDQKDLFSKIAYIRQVTGLVTKMYFILPFLFNWKADSMFRQDYLHRLAEVKEAGLNVIFFTDDTGKPIINDTDFPVKAFEDSLRDIFS